MRQRSALQMLHQQRRNRWDDGKAGDPLTLHDIEDRGRIGEGALDDERRANTERREDLREPVGKCQRQDAEDDVLACVLEICGN